MFFLMIFLVFFAGSAGKPPLFRPKMEVIFKPVSEALRRLLIEIVAPGRGNPSFCELDTSSPEIMYYV